ncbi:MAG: LCP family protein [Clostridiales bacterium]|nr:LCP family protein [Clostridiales bacterium]
MPELKRKKSHKRLSNAMVFLLVFFIFLLVFGGICLWAVVQINHDRGSSDPSTPSSSGEPVFTASDARSLLVITVDDDAPQGFIAVRSDPANARLRTMAIPRDTELYEGTEAYRLWELYQARGVIATQAALESLTGIAFDNYAIITYENIERLITYLENGVYITLSENLEYSGEGYFISMEGGPRSLTAPQVVNVLRYPAWQGGRRQKANIQAQMLAAILNQYLTEARIATGDKDFSTIVNLLQSDIRVSHFASAKAGLDDLSRQNKEGNICETMVFEGEFVGNGDLLRFYAASDIQDILRPIFGG